MFLSLANWLKLFECKKMKYDVFASKIKIRRRNGEISLMHDLPEKKLTPDFLRLLYEIMVEDKILYLTKYYNNNLKILSITPLNTLNNLRCPQNKNIIRNMYFRQILEYTGTSQPNLRSYLSVLKDFFKNYVLDYKLLTPSAIDMIKKGQLPSVFSAYYFRASIMNPNIPYALSLNFTEKFNVLTPTLGWSSYLLGLLHNRNLQYYVGIDVIPVVCKKTERIARLNGISSDFYCCPSEDLYKDATFMSKYKEYFDFVFFSPPYFKLEEYPGQNQSTKLYSNYNEWIEKYWRPTMLLCYETLKKNGLMIYIVSGYNDKKKYIDLENDFKTVALSIGFKHVHSVGMTGNNIGITKHREAKETIFTFSKGNNRLKNHYDDSHATSIKLILPGWGKDESKLTKKPVTIRRQRTRSKKA